VAVTHGDAKDADQLDPRTGRATAIGLGGAPAGAAVGAGSFRVSVATPPWPGSTRPAAG
jgi:hypothetical protein